MGDQRPRHDRYGNPQNYSTDSYPSTGYGRSPASGGYETSYSASSTTSSTPSYNATPASATGPNWRWWISDEGIAREVIQADIQRYLGPEAVVRPGGGLNENQGLSGYWIAAYRTLTQTMIQDLKADSANWYRDGGRREGGRYEDSMVHRSRQHWGPTGSTPSQAPAQPAPATTTYAPQTSERVYEDPYRRGGYTEPAPTYANPYPQQGQTDPYGRSVGTAAPQQNVQYPTSTQPYVAAPSGGAVPNQYPTNQPYPYDQRQIPRTADPRAPGASTDSRTGYTGAPAYQSRPQQSTRQPRPGYYIASDGNEYPRDQMPQ